KHDIRSSDSGIRPSRIDHHTRVRHIDVAALPAHVFLLDQGARYWRVRRRSTGRCARIHDDLPQTTRLTESLLEPLGADGRIDRHGGIHEEAQRCMPDLRSDTARPGELAQPPGVA